MKLAVTCMILLLMSAKAVCAQDAASAEHFLRDIYSGYGKNMTESKIFEEDADRIFEPSLVSLMKRDQALAEGEEWGNGIDPICDCQDDEGLVVKNIAVQPVKDGKTHAEVSLFFAHAPATQNHAIVKYDLVSVQGHWRVHDINDSDINRPEMPDSNFIKALENNIAEYQKN